MNTDNPRTIADLKFNWIFLENYRSVSDLKNQFTSLNPQLIGFKVKPKTYKFFLNEKSFKFDIFRNVNDDLIWLLDGIELSLPALRNCKFPAKLNKFELMSEDVFRIYLSPVI